MVLVIVQIVNIVIFCELPIYRRLNDLLLPESSAQTSAYRKNKLCSGPVGSPRLFPTQTCFFSLQSAQPPKISGGGICCTA